MSFCLVTMLCESVSCGLDGHIIHTLRQSFSLLIFYLTVIIFHRARDLNLSATDVVISIALETDLGHNSPWAYTGFDRCAF